MDSPTIGWGGLEPPVGDAGVWHYPAQPECLVQCSGVGKEEGWQPMALHWLSPSEHSHRKRLLPPAQNTGGIGEFGRCWTFFLLGPQIRVLADKDGGGIKAVTTFTVGNLGFFECDCMPFGLCNALATFQQLMQNCLGKLNLIFCLTYLDHLIMFSRTAEEHLHPLCIMFDWLREYNLKLKPSKCSLF